MTSLPLCVGFGISNGHQAKSMAEICDGVIVGSALIDVIKGREQDPDALKKLISLLAVLREAVYVNNTA